MPFLVVTVAILSFFALLYWIFMSPYSQLFIRYPYRRMTTTKTIALTLDDGPNEPYTSMLADFLHERDVKATFFEVGRCIERYPEVTRRLLSDGHVIANHSLSHQFHQYFAHASFAVEIDHNQQIIADVIGKRPALYRSPWLVRHPLLLATLRRRGLQPVSGVFCHDLEVAQIPAARIARKAIKRAKPGMIIIFHDGVEGRGGNRAETVEAVKLFVDALLNKGYTFVTVDKLLGIPAYQET